jgi:SHS2 domain-containing protein
MPFTFLDHIATADIAFKAWGRTLDELFKAASEATMQVMVEDLSHIERRDTRTIRIHETSLELLLFQFLQEFIFYKDAECLLLKVETLQLQSANEEFHLEALLVGEPLDPARHLLNVDIKAVTFHRFGVVQSGDGWEATVVLDI